MNIKNNFIEAANLLNEFINNDDNFIKMERIANKMVDSIKSGNKIISCGNGGSMSDAMHFAEELTGNFRVGRMPLPAICISDPSHLTCVGNDYGYDYIFSRYIMALGKEGDVLLAISTSGNSSNIINAVNMAKNKGIFTIGLTGKDGGVLKDICDIEIRVPHNGFSDRIQEIHIKIIHSLIHYVEEKITI